MLWTIFIGTKLLDYITFLLNSIENFTKIMLSKTIRINPFS